MEVGTGMGDEDAPKAEGPAPTAHADGRWTDQRTEEVIGGLLRAGVLAAAFLVTVGGALYLRAFGALPPHHGVFRGEPADLRTVGGIVQDALKGSSRGVIQAGLLLLIATPIARVLFSVWAFARERDGLYVAITLVVLATLLFSLVAHVG